MIIFLITGIGCIGKSSLREKTAMNFPSQVISVDMDYEKEIPHVKNKIVIVESVHGLDENPQKFDKILYLLPPKGHTVLWLIRAWTWFSTGIVDFAAPKGKRKKFAISNIPIILKMLIRNIFMRKRWIKVDLCQNQVELKGKIFVASSISDGYKIIKSWIINYANFGELNKTGEIN